MDFPNLTLLYTKYYTYVYAKMERYLICLHVIWKGRTGRVNGASFLCDVEPVNLCHVTSPKKIIYQVFQPPPPLTPYPGSTFAESKGEGEARAENQGWKVETGVVMVPEL